MINFLVLPLTTHNDFEEFYVFVAEPNAALCFCRGKLSAYTRYHLITLLYIGNGWYKEYLLFYVIFESRLSHCIDFYTCL